MRVAVLGGGAWGTALAAHLVRSGRSVTLWAREEPVVSAINARHENPIYLPGIALPEGLKAVGEIPAAVSGVEIVLVVVPSEFCRSVYREARGSLDPKA